MKKIILIIFFLISFVLIQDAHAVQPIFYFDVIVDAEVSDLGGGAWLYEYTLSAAPAPGDNFRFKDLSHWSIELPEHKIPTISDINPESGSEIGYFNEPAIESFIWGVKWNSDQLITYSFESTHGPVLNPDGSINTSAYNWYAKSASDFTDTGLTLGPNGSGERSVVPEPATAFLLTSGLLSLAGLRRKRKN